MKNKKSNRSFQNTSQVSVHPEQTQYTQKVNNINSDIQNKTPRTIKRISKPKQYNYEPQAEISNTLDIIDLDKYQINSPNSRAGENDHILLDKNYNNSNIQLDQDQLLQAPSLTKIQMEKGFQLEFQQQQGSINNNNLNNNNNDIQCLQPTSQQQSNKMDSDLENHSDSTQPAKSSQRNNNTNDQTIKQIHIDDGLNLSYNTKNKLKDQLIIFFIVFMIIQFNFIMTVFYLYMYHNKFSFKSKKTKLLFMAIILALSIVWQISTVQLVQFYIMKVPQKEIEQYETEMFIALISILLVWILLYVYGKRGFQNHALYWIVFKQPQNYIDHQISKTINKIQVSKNLFVFKFLQYYPEIIENNSQTSDEQKQQQKIMQKRLQKLQANYNSQNKNNQNQNNNLETQYSGTEFSKKLYQILQKQTRKDKWQLYLIIFVSLVSFNKALYPSINRALYENDPFLGISPRWAISYINVIGIVYGEFIRAIFSTYDLKIIYGFQKVTTQLINFDCYTKKNDMQQILNFPPIDFLDPNSIITWNNIKKIGLQFKRKETLPLDAVSLILGIYWLFMATLWLMFSFGDTVVFEPLFKASWTHRYIIMDLCVITIFFLFRILYQLRINQEYTKQLKQLQKLKSLIYSLYQQPQLLQPDIDQNDMEESQSLLQNNSNNNDQEKDDVYNFQQFNMQRLNEKFQGNQPQIDSHIKKLISTIDYIRQDIKDLNRRKPFKFLGIIPASQNLLISIATSMCSMIGSFLYYMHSSGNLKDLA